MEKEFEKWLKRSKLFEYYIANPKQQEDIYKDYQREKEYFKLENIDEWVKWLCNNPELAERHYPLLVNSLKERIQNTEPFLIANMIQNLPEQFTIWKTEINNHSGNYREKKIKEHITLLNGVLNEWEYPTEIERQAVVSVSPYLIEQLEFWKRELQLNTETLPPQPIVKQKPEPKETERLKKIKKLKSIWLAEPKLTVEDFLKKGNNKGFWNDNLDLTLQRGISTYGIGKTFLGNIFIAFKGWAIPEHLNYNEAGKIFCEVFNVKVKEATKEKYKAFSSGNEKQIREIKRTFGF